MDTIKIENSRVKMIAHRGVSGLEEENTCAAFVAAGNRSYFGIETDVHKTKDGRFIIIHDDRTGRVSPIDHSVEGTDFDTLRALHLYDREPGRFRGDLIPPTLEEYISICKRYEKTAVLELKNHMDTEDIRRIVAAIAEEGYLEQTIFISFDLPNMISVRSLLPHQKAQYLIEGKIPDDLIGTLKKYALDLDVDHHLLTREFVERLHAAGIEINVWTVNDLADARRLAQWGVDYITSNIIE